MKVNLGKIFTLSMVAGILLAGTVKGQVSENSVLWKIEGKEIKTSYVFGTFHILPQSEFELKQKVLEGMKNTSQLVLELDMDDPTLQTQIMQNTGMKDGHQLDEYLEPKDLEKLDLLLKETIGTGLEPWTKVKPFMISSFLIGRFVGEQPASFETSLTQLAKQSGKEVLGLETPQEQLSVFDQIDYQDQADDLLEMIHEEDKMKALFSQMIRLYKQEQMLELFDLSKEHFDGENELELLLTNRNRNWIPRMENMMKDKSTFFAVGAGHLGGEEGVISLLSTKGFELTAVE